MKTLNACFKKRFQKAVFAGLDRGIFLGCALAFLLAPLAARAQDRTVLTGHVLPVVKTATPAGSPSPDTHLRLAIGLPLRNRGVLTNLLRGIYDPASTNYHHYLTPDQFASQFGPADADYQAVIAFAQSNHLVLTNALQPNRLLVEVDGAVADIEKAFNIKMRLFQHPTESRTFYAPTNEPSVPAGLQVLDISGLNNYSIPHPKYHVISSNAVPKSGSAPGGAYMGDDLRAAYVPGVTLNGTGQTVGLLQFDGYYPSDILQYETLNNRPNVTLTNVLLGGFSGAPTGFGGEIEVSLDLEMVISMAPGVSKIIVYEDNPFNFSPNLILNRIATDNLAKQIGCSWGWSGGPQASTEQIFLQMDAQGQTFCNASGDNDAFAPGQVDDPTYPGSPSSSPNIMQVGATTLTTSGPGGNWVSEKVWQWGGDIGSSGGISSYYAIPTWQQPVNMTTNQGSTSQRNIPDVAMVGDNVFVIADQGIQYTVGGTSCAAPLWAGFTALVNQQGTAAGQGPVGFMNPALYAIGLGSGYNLSFHDIVVGNNTNSVSPNLFFAVPGYDLCTGWGTPTGANLINTLAPPSATPVFAVTNTVVAGGNGNGMIDANECNSFYIGLQNVGLQDATTVQVQLSTTTPGVVVASSLGKYPNIAAGASATNLNPFEISTTPGFVCGSTIYFTLAIKCDQGTSSKTFALTTGAPGTPIQFDSSAPVNIIGGSTNGTPSTIFVTNITTAIQHVSVSAYIFESLDYDLTLQLIAPDGTAVTLAQNDGQSGQNYGIDCTASDRTTFDDLAGAPIGTGVAPFIGTFTPMQPLATFNGKSGTNINGTWQLLATDPYSGDTGVIECWSLFLTPALCEDGGGQCPGVDLGISMSASPDPVQVYSNVTYSILVTNRGPDTATSVAVEQSLPPTFTFVSATSSQGFCSYASNLLSCSLGSMDAGQFAVVTVVASPTVAGTLYTTATVGAQQQELNPGDNSATVVTHVQEPSADLSVSLAAAPSPVNLNAQLVYTATIVNHGPSTASNILFTNLLPQNVAMISTAISQGSVTSSGNAILASLGNLKAGAAATVTMKIVPLVLGPITDTASVSSTVLDPVSANNTASITTQVMPAADLVLTMTAPVSVVVGSNYTYQITVQNYGPSPATDVNIRDNLPASLTLISATSPQGQVNISDNTVSCLISNLDVTASATFTITVGTANLIGNVPAQVPNSAIVTADQSDPNTTNNTANVSTLVTYPTLNVVAAGYQLISENSHPTNGMIDPGETVSLALRLQNIGNIDSAANLTATLLNSGGVTPIGNPVRNYGTLTASGLAGSQTFAFTAASSNGALITANLQLQNNGTNLSIVSFPLVLSLSNNFANTNDIIIPDHGPGSLYPSTNVVAGVAGVVGKVTVTFTNFNHTYPDDVDILLVGPGGQNVLLMSHAGNGGVLTNTFLGFDPGVTNANGTAKLLPSSSQILPGMYQPTQYSANSVNFTNLGNNPPPAPPYGTNLNIFNGTPANGAWLLYVFDSSPGDAGIIKGGWSLGITSGNEVNPVVDLGVSGKVTPNPVLEPANLTYTFTVTNTGPNPASVVQFTNVLPTNVTFVSATNSAHALCATNANGAVYCTLTNLPAGANVTVTIVVTPNGAGTLTSVASVTGADSDPNQSNNSTTVFATVNAPVSDLAVTMTGPTNIIVGVPAVYTVSITNNGPGTALGVVMSDPLQGVLGFINGSASGSAGQPGMAGYTVVCNVGTLAPGAGATINLSLVCTQVLTFTNTVSVTTTSSDTNSANNFASIITAFQPPAPLIVASGARLISGPANGSLVPGQPVTVAFSLANIGSANTENLQATLLASNGVASPSGQATYGVLVAGGASAAQNFTFTPSGINGGSVTATLQLTDGGNNLGTVSFPFNLPATNTFVNSAAIIIPDHGAAAPYPSVITVSNVPGIVSKATVTLNNFSHGFPDDVEVLLAAPSGQNVVLFAHTGGGLTVSNLVLTFDDAASTNLPVSSDYVTAPLVSGTFRPSDYGLALPFPAPAPTAVTGSTLSAFNGVVANGDWTLYVFDNTPGDNGSIANGWTLNLSSASPVNQAADLGVSLTTAGLNYPGIPFTVNVTVTNKGAATANNVLVSNTLPAGITLLSSTLGSTNSKSGGTTVLNIGSIPAGSAASFNIAAVAGAGGYYTGAVSVGSDQADVNTQDNVAQLGVQVQNPPKLTAKAGKTNGVLGVTLSVNGGQSGTYQIVTSTNLALKLNQWATIWTTNAGTFQFTDTNTASSPRRFYRVVFTP